MPIGGLNTTLCKQLLRRHHRLSWLIECEGAIARLVVVALSFQSPTVCVWACSWARVCPCCTDCATAPFRQYLRIRRRRPGNGCGCGWYAAHNQTTSLLIFEFSYAAELFLKFRFLPQPDGKNETRGCLAALCQIATCKISR